MENRERRIVCQAKVRTNKMWGRSWYIKNKCVHLCQNWKSYRKFGKYKIHIPWYMCWYVYMYIVTTIPLARFSTFVTHIGHQRRKRRTLMFTSQKNVNVTMIRVDCFYFLFRHCSADGRTDIITCSLASSNWSLVWD